jgi:long-chain fatty acid transport protein
MLRRTVPILAVAVLAWGWQPGQVSATDGHFLHGVGAVNSAMGGVGVAMPRDVLGALYTNPAGLMAFKASRADFSFEMFKPTLSLYSKHPMGFEGTTEGSTEWTPIPALAWATPVGERAVLSLGGLGIGGFGVNYPASAVSAQGVPANPILAPTSTGGFGQLYSNFQLMKIAPAIAFSATDNLWIGAALNLDWASLSVMPAPMAYPDMGEGMGMQGPQPQAYYPDATAADAAFGVGFQLGLTWLATEHVSLGLSYTSQQWFQDFEFNSTVKAPGSEQGGFPNFGFPREIITFAMDVPAVYAAGVAWSSERAHLGADVKYITYSSTPGFEESGFDQTGAVKGFGWDDILVVAVGGDYWLSDAFGVRAGYNFSENPISEEQAFFNIPAPAIMQHHFSAGFGWKFSSNMEFSLAYYHVLESDVSGPFYGATGPIPGSQVTSSMSENSVIIGFSVAGG